jgi:hypothetical protein
VFAVDVNNEVKQDVAREAKRRKNAFETLALRYGAGAISVDTKSSFVEKLIVYFKMRKERRR